MPRYGSQAGRKYKTDDVVNDTPLPEFKVDFSTLQRLIAPRRPLKPTPKIVSNEAAPEHNRT